MPKGLLRAVPACVHLGLVMLLLLLLLLHPTNAAAGRTCISSRDMACIQQAVSPCRSDTASVATRDTASLLCS